MVVSPSPLFFSLPFLVSHCGAWQLPLRTMTYWRDPTVIRAEHGSFVFWPQSDKLAFRHSRKVGACLG